MAAPTIIAGAFRRKRLVVPEGLTVRPTRSLVRGALYDMVGERVVEARALDLYAGAGVLGLEALSRGARHCTFVERNRRAQAALRKNIASCGLGPERATVVPLDADALRPPLGEPFDLLLLDPPFKRADPLPAALSIPEIVTPEALLVWHAPSERPCPVHLGPWRQERTRSYGRSTVALYLLEIGPETAS